jgi:hypothetical protein
VHNAELSRAFGPRARITLPASSSPRQMHRFACTASTSQALVCTPQAPTFIAYSYLSSSLPCRLRQNAETPIPLTPCDRRPEPLVWSHCLSLSVLNSRARLAVDGISHALSSYPSSRPQTAAAPIVKMRQSMNSFGARQRPSWVRGPHHRCHMLTTALIYLAAWSWG